MFGGFIHERNQRKLAKAMASLKGVVTVRKERPGFWTHDDEAAKDGVGHLYYFAPSVRSKPSIHASTRGQGDHRHSGRRNTGGGGAD